MNWALINQYIANKTTNLPVGHWLRYNKIERTFFFFQMIPFHMIKNDNRKVKGNKENKIEIFRFQRTNFPNKKVTDLVQNDGIKQGCC